MNPQVIDDFVARFDSVDCLRKAELLEVPPGSDVSHLRKLIDIIHSICYNEEIGDVTGFHVELEVNSRFGNFGQAEKSEGRIRTPVHIAQLMAELADVRPTSRVLDPCCGSGTILSAAIERAASLADSNTVLGELQREIFRGIEIDLDMFLLSHSNLFFSGISGHSNLQRGSVFDTELINTFLQDFNPNVILMNPPHGLATSVWDYLHKAIELSNPGAKIVCVFPISELANKTGQPHSNARNRLMQNATIKQIISLPEEIYKEDQNSDTSEVGLVVLESHRPHEDDDPVWFAWWPNDGHIYRRYRGRNPSENADPNWDEIRSSWVFDSRSLAERAILRDPNREPPIFGASKIGTITRTTNWVPQYQFNADLSWLEQDDLRKRVQEYMLFRNYYG